MSYAIPYQLVQKPLSERLIDATCIYFKIENKEKLKGALLKGNDLVQKRQILIYLLYHEASEGLTEIGTMLKLSKSSVSEAIDTIESTKGHYRTISEHIKQITAISTTLDYKMITIIQSIQ